MIRVARHFLCVTWLVSVSILVGCSAKQAAPSPSKPETTDQPSIDGAFKLGDMIPAFSPPPLAELDKSAQWQDQPVVDSLAKLRALKKSDPPLVSVAEALKSAQ